MFFRLVLLAGLEPWISQAMVKNCDWYSHKGVTYTESPWTFQVDKDCTTLELPVRNLFGIGLWGGMDSSGGVSLAEAIKNMTTLKKLDLDYNYIQDEGAAAVATALQHMPAMAAMEFKANGIGDVGIKAISVELWHTPQLTHLDLERNKIGPSGARALAAALRKTPMLMFLSLGENKIGDAGAKALAQVLRHMPSLTGLDVSSNGLTEDGQLVLAAAMARIELGRGGELFQFVRGISENQLEAARKDRPRPPVDVMEAKHVDLQVIPMWKFLNKQCGMTDEKKLDGLVALLAALGVQEVKDLNLWSDFEIERNLKSSGMHEDIRNALRQCVDSQVRATSTEPPTVHSEQTEEL